MPAYRVSAVRGRGLFLGTEEGIASLPSVCNAGRGLFLGTEEGIASLPSVCSAGAGVIPGN